MSEQCIALLGRRDEPTDAVEQYCQYLAEALRVHGFDLQLTRVPWPEKRWPAALRDLKKQAPKWRGQWVLLQYTALAWSTRGFPNRVRRVLRVLHEAEVRIGVVFHDAGPYEGKRMVDWLRRRAQVGAMRGALRTAELGVFTVALEKIAWIQQQPTNAIFIPVGANLPVSAANSPERTIKASETLTVAVFGITGGQAAQQEIRDIAEGVRLAAAEIKSLRLVVLGRNSESIETDLRKLLHDVPVEVRVTGVLRGEEVVRELSAADAMLFVRSPISTRRGSAIAGIACGLPLIACAGAETAAPITEAGLELYKREQKGDLAAALLRVLKDDAHRNFLAARSRRAQELYFSWSAIAKRYAEALSRKK